MRIRILLLKIMGHPLFFNGKVCDEEYAVMLDAFFEVIVSGVPGSTRFVNTDGIEMCFCDPFNIHNLPSDSLGFLVVSGVEYTWNIVLPHAF